jgi:hypothetical protein
MIHKFKALSYHNAGHAVATALIEDAHAGHSCGDVAHESRWSAEYNTMTALGGVVAERLFLGLVDPTGAKNDVENAFRHISALTGVPGEQTAYVNFLNSRVEYMLEQHRPFIDYVASMIDDGDLTSANDVARAALKRFLVSG